MKHLYALLPGLSSEVGHLFHYHVAVQKIVEEMGWSYRVFVPRKTEISPLPSRWIPSLANDRWDGVKGLKTRLKTLLANILPFRRIFQSIEEQEDAVVFIEYFELQHLAALFLALSLLRPKFQFWILHRFAFGKWHFKTLIYRFFHWRLERKLGKENVRYLTDSELLAAAQKKVFYRPVTVVPIPHVRGIGEKKSKENSLFLIWWPGGSIREDKGLSKILKLAEQLKTKPSTRLVLAKKAKELFPRQQILFIPTVLSREKYVKWMQRVDLVLLPYNPEDYGQRTSGIFVEAVLCGTLPITTKGTWMAYELEKFGLSELIFDWQEPNLVELLHSLPSQPKVLHKMEGMRAHYRNFHSKEGVERMLRSL